MISRAGEGDDYFREIGDRVEANLCPYCGTGMTLVSLKHRTCTKCHHWEKSSIPFRHNLKFVSKINEIDRTVTITAYNPGNKFCFKVVVPSITAADSYISDMMQGHVKNVSDKLSPV